MTSRLERLAGPGGVLAQEPPDVKEFEGLVRSGLARLEDAENDDTATVREIISGRPPVRRLFRLAFTGLSAQSL